MTWHCLKIHYERSHHEELENTGVWKKMFSKSLENTFKALPNIQDGVLS